MLLYLISYHNLIVWYTCISIPTFGYDKGVLLATTKIKPALSTQHPAQTVKQFPS